jgi:aspartate/tyrosine/aromatic aminotransferase
MQKLLSKDHFEITTGENILFLNQKANEARAKGLKVINGTTGMLFNEDGHLVDFPLVDQIISSSAKEDIKKYGPVTGGKEFSNAILDWLFEKVDYSKLNHFVVGSFGGTGALTLAMRSYLDKGQCAIVPSIRWSNYDSIAFQVGGTISEYRLFNEKGTMDIDSLKSKVNESLDKFGRAFLLINDPCQNPTVYTIKEQEWKEILSFLNEASNRGPIVLLDDIAYLNYSKVSYDKTIQMILNSLNENFMAIFTFSASKTLSIYGLRGGAAIAFSPSTSVIDDFQTAMTGCARSIWSSVSTITSRVITENLNSFEKREILRKKLTEYIDVLLERATLFTSEADNVGLPYYPYDCGFFILIPCVNDREVVDELIKENIYVVPFNGGIRIALSCLTKEEIKGLATRIKVAYDKYNK